MYNSTPLLQTQVRPEGYLTREIEDRITLVIAFLPHSYQPYMTLLSMTEILRSLCN